MSLLIFLAQFRSRAPVLIFWPAYEPVIRRGI